MVVGYLSQRKRVERRAIFPSSPPITRLPIRAPLGRPDLSVMATLRVSEKKSAPVWMSVDSGATGVTMPTESYYGLGLDRLTGVTVRQEDPTGRVIHRDAGLVPQMTLGPLVIEDVVTALGGGATVLGQSVLSHGSWEIDWDRGLLTLGASRWTSDATILPLRKEGDSEVVTMTIDGAPVDMVLDTGAYVSTIPETVGDGAGLHWKRTAPTTLHALTGEIVVRRTFVGDVKLGPLTIGRMELAGIHSGGRRAKLGLLGLDVLSRYHVQVIPGAAIALRPRHDVAPRERIARWDFIPQSCEHMGCVHATFADGHLRVAIEADIEQPLEVLFACGSGKLRVRMPRTRNAEAVLPDAPCTSLDTLDVAPLAPTAFTANEPEPSGNQLQAMLWP
jgi:predicted aspartyl protease